MAGEQKHIWLTSALAAGAATAVVMAASGYALVTWGMPQAQHYLNARLAVLDSKLDSTSASLAQKVANNNVALAGKLAQSTSETQAAIKKLPSLESTTKALADATSEIETLNSRIKKTNEALTDIQKQVSLASIKAGLAPLDGKLDKANTTLAALQAGLARADDTRNANEAPRSDALARIEKTIGSVKQQLAANAAQLAALKEQIAGNKQQTAASGEQLSASAKPDGKEASATLDAMQAALAKMQTTAETLSAGVSANTAALGETQKSLAGLQAAVTQGFAGAASSTDLKDTVAALKQPLSAEAAPKKRADDLVVFYVSPSAAARARQVAAPPPSDVPPMSVRFEKIGGLDDNGQTALIASKLRAILKGRKGCTVAVAGHADTVGGDNINHDLSRRRASAVAKKLKAAFAGDDVTITETAWGERKLQEWTPDNTPDVSNRRVDIAVQCKGG